MDDYNPDFKNWKNCRRLFLKFKPKSGSTRQLAVLMADKNVTEIVNACDMENSIFQTIAATFFQIPPHVLQSMTKDAIQRAGRAKNPQKLSNLSDAAYSRSYAG